MNRASQLDHDTADRLASLSPRVKALEWHERLRTGDREGFVCSEGGILSYSIMLSRNRVYGIAGEHDGAAEFTSLDAAKAAAQADYERRIMSALVFHEPAKDGPEVVAWIGPYGDFTRIKTATTGHHEPLVRQSALTACQQEVERLTQERDEALEAENDGEFWQEKFQTAEAQLAQCREALGFYAKGFAPTGHDRFYEPTRALLNDCGRIARAALGGQSNEA